MKIVNYEDADIIKIVNLLLSTISSNKGDN